MADSQTLPALFQELKNIYSTYVTDQYQEDGETVEVIRSLSPLEQEAFSRQAQDFVERLIGSLIFNFRHDNHHLGSGTDPLFAHLLAHCQRVMDFTIPTPTTIGFDESDQLVLWIHPLRFIGLVQSVLEARDLIRHECFHLLFEHLTMYQSALNDPNQREWANLATDVQINQNLNHMPVGSVTLEEVEEIVEHALDPFEGSAYYYQALKKASEEREKSREQDKAQKKQEGGGSEHGAGLGNEGVDSADKQGVAKQAGEFNPNPTEDRANTNTKAPTSPQLIRSSDLQNSKRHDAFQSDSDHRQLQENTVRQAVKEALNQLTERQRGSFTSRIEQAVNAFQHEPALDWRRLVKQGFGRLPRGYHPTKKHMNRRQPERIDLSGRQVDHQVTLLVFVDTSASMSEEELAYILGELQNIAHQLAAKVKVIQTDNEIKRVDELGKVDMANIMYKGRGGTLFTPAFQWLHEEGYNNHNSLAVYFTDGFGESEGSLNRYGYRNMYWVLVGDSVNDLSVESYGRAYLLINDPKYVQSGLAKPNDKWKGGL
ncbi:MAG: VWA-like domain-containing protein [Aerococcus sp.]|nr:VWA-like domain-containing protein [Aerococcus sp.]